MREYVDLNELYPLIKEVIENGGEFRFFPRGTSMEPLLHQGDDSVVLGAPENIAAGDVVFYRRENGAFVLHRLVEIRGGTYTMCGDNQKMLEHGIKPSQVFAKMVGYYKGETYHSTDEADYLAYSKKQISRFPYHQRNPKILAILVKIKKLLKKS